MTHIDALAHFSWDGRMYGGRPASLVSDVGGAKVHDVTAISNGIVCRGVLLDLTRQRGGEPIAHDDHIFPDDLENAADRQGVTILPGDALLIRTGEGLLRRSAGNSYDIQRPRTGLQAACIPWLYGRNISVLGSDVVQDPTHGGYESMRMPIYTIGIVSMGLWLIDNCQLEELAGTCERLGRWEFQFLVAPVRFSGATGSPVNPLAVF